MSTTTSVADSSAIAITKRYRALIIVAHAEDRVRLAAEAGVEGGSSVFDCGSPIERLARRSSVLGFPA